jgi:methylglyoxal synthase
MLRSIYSTKEGAMTRRGRIALSTTPGFRGRDERAFETFVLRDLYTLSQGLEIVSTDGTREAILKVVDREISNGDLDLIRQGSKLPIRSTDDLAPWRECIKDNLTAVGPNIAGMIKITRELVCGRLDAVLHFCDLDNFLTRTDSRVLRRQANVHNVPIASDLDSADSMITKWRRSLGESSDGPIFPYREQLRDPLARVKDGEEIIALIAHNEMKLALCEFVVRNARRILEFDRILCTGTTGTRVIQFLGAGSTHNQSEIEHKVVRCNSGPYGGDVQIAAAVIERKCGTVVFFQDPHSAHEHEADISLFEQALLSGVRVRFASNPRTAEELLDCAPTSMVRKGAESSIRSVHGQRPARSPILGGRG